MPNADALRARVKKFAADVLKFARTLPRNPTSDIVARQLARAGTGISSNYHSCGRARSRAEFVARLAVVVDEADESHHWLSLMREAGLASQEALEPLIRESGELRAIFSAALATSRRRQR
jgi:four helix bundle protein